mmetsp:Transcript_56967/g.132829  ORF Transcript_56967/g.132829 Transcript_56967/m.132829 type:complete len:249 (+) Transcript_56967:1-747(+)
MCLTRICGRSLALQQVSKEPEGKMAPLASTEPPPAPRSRGSPSCKDLLPLEPSVGSAGLREALLGLVFRPLAGVLGPMTPRAAPEGPRAVETTPRLLRGPHRLVRCLRQEDEEVQRLLAELAFDVGAGACYEDHAPANDPSRINILTDAELLIVHTTPARVERRWALEGIDPRSVKVQGVWVVFNADMGTADGDELQVGPSAVRCSTASTARTLAASLRSTSNEAQFGRGVTLRAMGGAMRSGPVVSL